MDVNTTFLLDIKLNYMYIQIEGMQDLACSYVNLNLCIYGRGLNAFLAVLIQKLKYYSQDILKRNQSQCRVLFRIPRCFPHLTLALCVCFDFPTDSLTEQDNK